MKIAKVRQAKKEEWDALWQNCDYATFFHSREWAEICKVYSKGRIYPEPRLVLFSGGEKALIPLSCIKTRFPGLKKDYISSPEGTFGGWLSCDALTVEHSRLLVSYMLEKCGNLFWRVNPYDPNIFQAGVKPDNEFTQALNLSGGFEAVLSKFSRGNLRSIQKARESGITVRLADTVSDWGEYFEIYRSSLLRWGGNASSRYGWELFEEIRRRGPPFSRLWLAAFGEKIVSGAICFYSKRHIAGWHGSTLKDYLKFSPFYLLNYEIINDSCKSGYLWYDFNPSGGHEGVKAFKDSFGAEILSCPVMYGKQRKIFTFGR
jgi:hypothetical protein